MGRFKTGAVLSGVCRKNFPVRIAGILEEETKILEGEIRKLEEEERQTEELVEGFCGEFLEEMRGIVRGIRERRGEKEEEEAEKVEVIPKCETPIK